MQNFGNCRNSEMHSSLFLMNVPHLSMTRYTQMPVSSLRTQNVKAADPGRIICQAVYDILLYAPVEYLPRNVRTDLLRRAMAADVSIGKSARDVPLHPEQQKRLVSLRAFIRRTFAHIGVVEHNAMIRYTNYLMGSSSLPVDDIAFNRVTLDLIELHLRSLLLFAEKGDETDLVELIKIFTTGFEFVDSRMINGLPERSLVLFIDMVLSKYRTSDLKVNIVDALGNMEMTMYPLFYERLTHLESKIRGPPSHELMEMEDSLNVWHRLLLLRSWLSREGFSKMFLGQKLARQFLDEVSSASNSSGVANAILSICLVEIHFINERAEQLQFMVAIYLAFRLKCRNALGNNRLDDGFSIACKMLSVQDFSDVLDLVIDGLAKQGLEKTSLCDLIHLSGILVHDAPEGTLKITQEHVNRALNIFVNCSQYTTDTELIRHVVEFVAKYFNDRPAAIKSSHVSLTWALLGSCLAGASSHEEQTNRQIYQDAVSILSTLIRLRRDLILPSLPLLCVMLSRLIVCLKSMFPNLGARQSNLVSNTLPQWISPHKPLGNDESKALARLFTTLTTKTIIRTHNTSTTDTQKADSLARPLSKHISVVLKAYVDTLTDPLCILPSEMRRELEPGLFALCEIIGEQYRDAMMVTLDTAGKAVMKGLWREYEKQRYVGKG
ncbi:hypothetical protein QCA50_001600 [Cerrena zonata]|uniref:Nucleolar 27S pre-rRNA processing Urb2/Npa2 C-terminal domain-containing protein n=1 Tax=Cerrena zonata TaxID=2478898 RepID=A0AAW0GTN7_9APHY